MSVIQLFVRAADAGDTYLYWRWEDEAGRPYFARLARAELAAVTAELTRALPAPIESESAAAAAHRALKQGAYADPDRECDLARRLTRVVLPAALHAQLMVRVAARRIRIRLTPSPLLARIPWETIALDGDRRLVDVVDIAYDPPATLYAQRDREPSADWSVVSALPPLHVVDPRLPRRAVRTQGLRQVLDAAGRARFRTLVHPHAPDRVGVEYDRFQLCGDLRVPPRYSRLFYFGHVSAQPDEPGSACLHLSDVVSTWGIANAYRTPAGEHGTEEHRLDHRPLCALDLLLGTTTATEQERLAWTRSGIDGPVSGAVLWPMPQRVALIACEGGADYRSAETFGLVLAMLNAGAELVTTTRWGLPTNTAFPDAAARPTSRLAEAVDAAHGLADPVAAVAEWQRAELAAWRATGDLAHSPILWASLCHTFAPAGGYSGS